MIKIIYTILSDSVVEVGAYPEKSMFGKMNLEDLLARTLPLDLEAICSGRIQHLAAAFRDSIISFAYAPSPTIFKIS